MGDEAGVQLDAVDRHMIELLRADGRMSVNALAQTVGLSRASAYRRLHRLRRDGVIRGFTVRLDPALAGRPISALILVSVQQQRWRSIRDTLRDFAVEGVEYLAMTTGEVDFLVLVRVPDMATLRQLVLEHLHAIPGVVNTRTVFVLDEIVQP